VKKINKQLTSSKSKKKEIEIKGIIDWFEEILGDNLVKVLIHSVLIF